jgi:hypothetical protein
VSLVRPEPDKRAYFLRVLGKDSACVPLAVLREALAASELSFEVRCVASNDGGWLTLELCAQSGVPVARLSRVPISESNPLLLELSELLLELSDLRPESAVDWLTQYLPSVRVLYRFEILPAIDELAGWPALHIVQGAVWEWAGGILQSDGEGITNENGYFVLWQFREESHGLGNMAVLEDGDWIEFQMDLTDAEQRAAFSDGRVPDDAEEGALSSP